MITEIATYDHPDDPWVKDCVARVFPLGIRAGIYLRLRAILPWLRYGYTPHLVPWLRRHAQDYDVVVVNGLWNYSAFAAKRALVGSSVPYVVFTHGMLDPWFRKTAPLKTVFKQILWWFSEGPLLAHARAVLFTTEEESVLARNAFWPYHCVERVVNYGTADIPDEPQAQIEAFRAAMPQLEGRRYLLFLSRIHVKKGCDLLIEAFSRIAAQEPDLDLVIAGPDQTGWRRTLEEQARALGIADRIHWPGMVAGEVKWGAFRACEAFVLPSHQENFGIVVAEAMAAARPVLISDKVNIWREVEASGGGMVEPDTLAGAVRLLERFTALSPAERAEMGARARAGFLDRFEISRSFVSVKEALDDAAGRPGRWCPLHHAAHGPLPRTAGEDPGGVVPLPLEGSGRQERPGR